VRDGTFEFTVTSVEAGVTRVGSDLIGQDAQGQYVLVHLTVANIGTEAQYFSDSSQKAFDAQDRQFSADSAAGVYLDGNNTLLNQINPGNTVTGTVVYDVPADAKLTRLELHDSPFSGGVEVALG
jgi:hydrogenase maturation factor